MATAPLCTLPLALVVSGLPARVVAEVAFSCSHPTSLDIKLTGNIPPTYIYFRRSENIAATIFSRWNDDLIFLTSSDRPTKPLPMSEGASPSEGNGGS